MNLFGSKYSSTDCSFSVTTIGSYALQSEHYDAISISLHVWFKGGTFVDHKQQQCNKQINESKASSAK